jgi:anti-sigma regulatory factor (Ser/Thr protein kinase)
VSTSGGHDVVSWEFAVHDLRRIRDLLAGHAARAGVPGARVDDLVWTVNEFTSNVIVHGGGRGRVTVTTAVDGVEVAVTDWGSGLSQLGSEGLPSAHAQGGRGLWMARQLYPDLVITTGPAGTTVTVFTSRF